MTYTTPSGTYSRLYADMAEQTHLLIAGATGSGKSVVINGIIHALLHDAPTDDRFILIDVKRVELADYREIPHTMTYADDVHGAVQALQDAITVTEARFADMQRRGLRSYDGSHLYIIIDELADLMTTAKKQVAPLLQRLCQLGRAARVHVIAATQCPIAAVIPTPIKVNFSALLGLHTRSAQDSRNIIGEAGCEALPMYGYGLYVTPGRPTIRISIPMVEERERERIIRHWTDQRRYRLRLYA